MKHALYISEQAVKTYIDASFHERLNIMTRFFEKELPVVVSEMKNKLDEESERNDR